MRTVKGIHVIFALILLPFGVDYQDMLPKSTKVKQKIKKRIHIVNYALKCQGNYI